MMKSFVLEASRETHSSFFALQIPSINMNKNNGAAEVIP